MFISIFLSYLFKSNIKIYKIFYPQVPRIIKSMNIFCLFCSALCNFYYTNFGFTLLHFPSSSSFSWLPALVEGPLIHLYNICWNHIILLWFLIKFYKNKILVFSISIMFFIQSWIPQSQQCYELFMIRLQVNFATLKIFRGALTPATSSTTVCIEWN